MAIKYMNQLKYDFKVVRKGYRDISPILGLTNFILLTVVCLFVFLLLNYEPAKDWHTTSFVLQSTEYRYSRGGGVLDLHTTDGRVFVLNQNDEVIRYQLQEGSTYVAVYADNLLHDTIKALSDDETELLNIAVTKSKFHEDRVFMLIVTVVSSSLTIVINVIYSVFCIQEERRRMRKFQKSRKAKR